LSCALVSLATSAFAQSREGFTANGIHYRVEGRGADVVMIHGFHMDLREWDDVVQAMGESRRVVRYDVRGHGTSKVVTPLPSSVADLRSMLDELKISRATIVGLSMGSNIALDFALTHPDRVERLVLLSPGLAGIKASASLEWMRPIVGAVKSGSPDRAAELWWESPLLEGARRAGPRSARYRSIVLENAAVWTISAPPPQLEPPAGTRLKEVSMPTLAVAGEFDQSGSLEFARMIASGTPQGRVITLPAAWHMLSIEKPMDVARMILEPVGEP
jgi:2-succinyl-6-hydroxy-2,4-cyclohexadiene-1-carboxylate synthase